MRRRASGFSRGILLCFTLHATRSRASFPSQTPIAEGSPQSFYLSGPPVSVNFAFAGTGTSTDWRLETRSRNSMTWHTVLVASASLANQDNALTLRPGAACTACPGNSTSLQPGGTEVGHCLCDPGYQGLNAQDECDACPLNTYKSTSGTDACTACPDGNQGTTYAEASTDALKCVCNKGFILSGATCNRCEAGKYKDVIYKEASFGQSCTDCPAGKYNTGVASTSVADCQDCPTHTTAPAGTGFSSICKCDIASGFGGFYDIGNPCEQCTPGQFAQVGNVACGDCTAGTYSAIAKGSCDNCHAHSTSPSGSSSASACECSAGYQPGPAGDAGVSTCEPCPAGKYKDTAGDVNCVDCPTNKYRAIADDPTECSACPDGMTSPLGATLQTDCICDVNEFKVGDGDAATCGDCVAPESYSVPGALTSSECQCWLPAALLASTMLSTTTVGYYPLTHDLRGMQDDDLYNATGQALSINAVDGLRFDDDTGHIDVPSAVQSALLSASAESFTVMLYVKFDSIPPGGSKTILYFRYKADDSIAQSPLRFEQRNDGLQIICSPQSIGSAQFGEFTFTYGTQVNVLSGKWYLVGFTINPTDMSSVMFHIDTQSFSVDNAESGSTSFPTANELSTDGIRIGGGTVSFPGNIKHLTFSRGVVTDPYLRFLKTYMAAGAGSTCECPAGEDNTRGRCAACPVGTYKDAVGSEACAACPANATTSGAGGFRFADCQCPAGMYLEGTDACLSCVRGKYKSTDGNGACTACPTHASTGSAGSTASSDCQCEPGYTGSDGGACTACTDDTYKSFSGSASCDACPSGSTISDGASVVRDSAEQCRCAAGSYGVPGDVQEYRLVRTDGVGGAIVFDDVRFFDSTKSEVQIFA